MSSSHDYAESERLRALAEFRKEKAARLAASQPAMPQPTQPVKVSCQCAGFEMIRKPDGGFWRIDRHATFPSGDVPLLNDLKQQIGTAKVVAPDPLDFRAQGVL